MSDTEHNTSTASVETMLPRTLPSPLHINTQNTIDFSQTRSSPQISPYQNLTLTPTYNTTQFTQSGTYAPQTLSTVYQIPSAIHNTTVAPTYTQGLPNSNHNYTGSFTPQTNTYPQTMNTWTHTTTTTASTVNHIPPTSTQTALRCQHPNCIGVGRSRITCRQCQSSFHHTCVGLPDNLPTLPNLNFSCNLCLQFQQIQQQLVTQNQILQNMSMNVHSPTLKYKPLPINIPRFYGKHEEDPNEFLEKCESNLIAAACPPEQWLYAVTPQLQDRAKHWWIAQKITCKTWEDFTVRFTKYFNGPSQLVRAQAQFYGETQQDNEQCERFIGKKLQMWRRLNPHLDDHHAIASIIQMMKPAIRPYLITTPPRSIEQLLSITSEIERDCAQPHTKDHHSFHHTQKRSTDYSKKSEPIRHPKSEPIHQGAPKCHFCPDYHFHRDCPVKRSQNKQHEYHKKHDYHKKEEPRSNRQQEEKPHSSKTQTNIINTFSHKQTNNTTEHPCDSVMELICIPSRINNKKFNSIIDCGASANFIRSDLITFQSLEPVAQTANLADRDVSTKITGKTNLEIEIAGCKYNLTFYVCPSLNHDILLGQPFLHRFKVIINYSKCSVTIGNRKRRVIYWKTPTNKSVAKTDNPSKPNPKTKTRPHKNKPELGWAHCRAPRCLQKPDRQNSPPFKINTIKNIQHSQFSSRKVSTQSTGRASHNQGKRSQPFSPQQSQSKHNNDQFEHFGKYQRNKRSYSPKLPIDPPIIPPGTNVLFKDRSLSKGLYTIVSNIGQIYTVRCNYSRRKIKAHRSEINTISH
ncbi:hypothetical protein M8J77_010372 [Diaphorina citri]|nr:hypothetical protein M8J77_010372 [Diaphorina citri]